MHHISVPVAFLYHDTSKPVSCKLIVSTPKYKFKKEFDINEPIDKIEFISKNENGGKRRQTRKRKRRINNRKRRTRHK